MPAGSVRWRTYRCTLPCESAADAEHFTPAHRQRANPPGSSAHFGREELVVVPPAGLGEIHRCVGVLQQRIGNQPIIGIDADADAQGDMQFMAFNVVRRKLRSDQLLGNLGRILPALDFGEQDHELVAALAANAIRGTGHT